MFNQIKPGRFTTLKAKLPNWLLVLLVLTSLACSLGGLSGESSRKVIHIRKTLPTLTPTAVVGPPQDVVVVEAPGLVAEVSAVPQEPIAESPSLMPTVTATGTAQVSTQPVNSSVPPVATVTPNLPPSPASASGPAEAVDAPSPTPPPLPSPTPEPNSVSGAGGWSDAPSPTPPPLSSPTPEPNSIPGAGGWSFTSIQAAYDQEEEGVIMHGDMINNTGTAQVISYLTGTLFDGQTQVTASVDDAAVYWPLEIVPPGGQVPFELIAYDIQSVADFNLIVISEPIGDTPRQDFEFSELDPSTRGGYYCVRGKLWNQGNPLLDRLLILAVLYDDQDNIINFGTFEEPSPEYVLGDQALNFEVCAASYNHQIARHELRAVGL